MIVARTILNIRLGLKTLMLHKLRSMLTMLGVVFGVGSVVAMLAVGEGASMQALEQIRSLGSHNIIIDSIKPIDDEQSGDSGARMSVYGITYNDQMRIAESFGDVRRIVPVKVLRQEGRLAGRALDLRVVGTTHEWFELVQRPLLAGRVLVGEDLHRGGNPVVLTEFGARRLLAASNVIGQSLRIGAYVYEVVGIVESEEGVAGGQTPDQQIDAYIPIQVARQRYGDISVRRQAGSQEIEQVDLHQLIVEVDELEHVERTAAGIAAMFERFHGRPDYAIRVPLALLRQAEATKRTFNIVLGSIAGISLLVGGIGIMNIMLASVTERTREIGVRRAIGAKRRQITGQFLIETMVLSGLGGAVGIGFGVSIPALITMIADMPTVITGWSIFLSVGISLSVGIVFGLYPAVRAANLDPIVALRHE